MVLVLGVIHGHEMVGRQINRHNLKIQLLNSLSTIANGHEII